MYFILSKFERKILAITIENNLNAEKSTIGKVPP